MFLLVQHIHNLDFLSLSTALLAYEDSLLLFYVVLRRVYASVLGGRGRSYAWLQHGLPFSAALRLGRTAEQHAAAGLPFP